MKILPSDYEPVATSEADKALLMAPPNPFNYGFTLDDCVVQTVYARGGRGCTPMFVKDKVVQSPRGQQFKADAIAYNKATQRFEGREPSYWEELTTDDNGTLLVAENEQVYIKGHVYHRYSSSEKGDFATWHQVLSKTPKLRLPVR